MDSISEVIVVSDSGNRNTGCFIYDLKSGSLINTYKDEGKACNIAKRSLSLIGEDLVISASVNQPILRVWTVVRKDVDICKIVLPGQPTSLAVSNCGMYCAVGIEKLLYVWEVSTGCLLTYLDHHTQSISCIRFSSDGSHIISGGKDAKVLVWLLSEIVSASEKSDNAVPRFSWLHHAAEVTDIYVGSLGMFSRVVSASKDMTCRIYELETGYLLTTVHVDFAITAVTMDESEYFLILGSPEGNIYRINMFAVNDSEVQYSSSDKKCAFLGHSKEITCLSMSTTGKYLVSGSEDCSLRVWDIMSFTCIRKIAFEGSVTNAVIILLPAGLKQDSQYHPRMKIETFRRQYEPDDAVEFSSAKILSRKNSLMHLGAPDEYFDRYLLNCSEESLLSLNRNNLSLEKMSCINEQMYSFALSETYVLPDDSESQMEDSD